MILAQSAGAVEYTSYISAEGWDHPPNECPDTKKSDGETPVMLELWEKQSTPSLPSLSGPLWPRVVALDRVPSMGQIELFHIWTECKQMTYTKFNCLTI